MGKKDRKPAKSVAKKTRSSSLKTATISLVPILLAYFYFFAFKDHSQVLARQADFIPKVRTVNITCSRDYQNHPVFPGCTPTTKCGRGVVDGLASEEEIHVLRKLLLKAMKHGGSSGGASILDLHSGAMSMKSSFVDIKKYLKQEQLKEIFTESDMRVYSDVKLRIKRLIAETFGIDPNHLHLTSPTFFSKMTDKKAVTGHDEYWHQHIDKIQYGSFDYTSLLYLSDYSEEFEGGRFVFDETEEEKMGSTVEPRKGRVSFFTSGSENPHHVEKVTRGRRLALTVAFTCDVRKAIKDPSVVV